MTLIGRVNVPHHSSSFKCSNMIKTWCVHECHKVLDPSLASIIPIQKKSMHRFWNPLCIYKTPLEIPLAKNSTLLSAILKCIDCTTVADALGSICWAPCRIDNYHKKEEGVRDPIKCVCVGEKIPVHGHHVQDHCLMPLLVRHGWHSSWPSDKMHLVQDPPCLAHPHESPWQEHRPLDSSWLLTFEWNVEQPPIQIHSSKEHWHHPRLRVGVDFPWLQPRLGARSRRRMISIHPWWCHCCCCYWHPIHWWVW